MFAEIDRIGEKNSNKKLLLILSPGWEPVPPYGLACLKSFLQYNGIYARICDLNIQLYENLSKVRSLIKKKKKVLDIGVNILSNEISENDFDVIAFSVYDPSFNNALYISKKIKDEFKSGIPIVFGGPHISYIQGGVLDFDFIDVAITGEGELPMLDLMRRISSNKKIASPYCFYRDEKRIRAPIKKGIIQNLDLLPYPDFSDTNIHSYPLPAIITSLSRGCLHKCSFCGVPNIYGGYRYKSPMYILNELKTNMEKNDCNLVLITDALINANPKLLTDVCNVIIEENLGVYWASEALPAIQRNLAEKMQRAGCRFVYLSPETGSQKIADNMGKGVHIDVAKRTFKNLKDAKLTTSGWFIFGYPLETEDDTEKTFKFLSDINPFVDEVIFSPFGLGRNTLIYRKPKQFGITEIEERPYRMYCYYKTENPKFALKNQIKTFIELWENYSGNPFPSHGLYRDIIDMVKGKTTPSKDLQFLIGEKYEEVQFVYKAYGKDKDNNYSYINLFRESFKEVFAK
ncbi:MAG: B12-binding domain-containing radical SAM protein [Candidatus Altiarchaeota archaeon]|nr:B12-binding domain-containing radical SAM protein [Candidatus Altiarchaeota archaeon]